MKDESQLQCNILGPPGNEVYNLLRKFKRVNRNCGNEQFLSPRDGCVYSDVLKFVCEDNKTKMKEPPTVDTVRSEMSHFGVFDYVVFSSMLIGCAVIGVYYSLRKKEEEDSAEEYLMGGRNMSTLPIATSIIASCVSGVMLLGAPTETYLYGTEYAFVFIPTILGGLLASCLLLPVFYEMQLLSSFEYLEKRFDKSVRFFGSLMFAIGQIFWLPIVVYVAALAFSQCKVVLFCVTGADIHSVTTCVCTICIFYTCLGGLKAIVWTDVVQVAFMVGSTLMVCIKGSLDAGGFNEVWRINNEGGRLVIPTFEADLTTRHTFWAITFGGTIMYFQWSTIDQRLLQRYLSLPTLSHARRALWLFLLGLIGLTLMCCYAGLVIYAIYHDCDPLTTELAKAKDQLLPLTVMKSLSDLPGLPGFFLSGIFSASLSSLSSGLNSLSAVILEDFIKPFLSKGLSNRATSLIMRGAVVVFGILCLVLVLVVEKLGAVLPLSISLGSITSGPMLGVYVCGLFLPWVNAKGALFGGLLGLFASGFVIVGAQNAAARLNFHPKPTSVEGCLYYYNATFLASSSDGHDGAVFPLFKLSYFWYTAFGCFITVALAVIISALTGFTELTSIDPILLSPVIRSRLPLSEKLLDKEEILIRELKRLQA